MVLSCSHCDRQFDSKTYAKGLAGAEKALENHQKKVHGTELACSRCDRKFSAKDYRGGLAAAEKALESHQNTHGTVLSCDQCDRNFSSKAYRRGLAAAEKALESHQNSHGTVLSCDQCDRNFSSKNYRGGVAAAEKALESHQNAHSTQLSCSHCDRKFNSKDYRGLTAAEKALKQHQADAHKGRPGNDDWVPPPPVSSPGQWVPRDEFKGKKSFGAYRCDDCDKTWISAHAFRDYHQGCQNCETENLPLWMWKNFQRNSELVADRDSNSPHDRARCEACKAGVCLD